MVHFLVTAQYEAAIIKDHRIVQAVLGKFRNSVIYFNADTRLGTGALDQIIRAVMQGRDRHGADVGVLSYNENPERAQHYLMELGVSCGYITLNIGFEKSARIIMKALEAAEARGERRFVRVTVPSGRGKLNINLNSGAQTLSGTILDVSEVGMACMLSETYPPGTIFPDIQLQLWGSLCRVSGRIAGKRDVTDGIVHVVMFDPIKESSTRSKLYAFLKRVMQYEVDSVL
ncbi:MAG: PilZ domain-containing protein [Spirochaetaceae bacterium]|nr:MAG: PilZ domain-containing protein [Spirochaetaceae bacterium]